MLDFLAGGGQYVAIIILCFSCWAVGRSSRQLAMQAAAQPDTLPMQLDAASSNPEQSGDGRAIQPIAFLAQPENFSEQLSLSENDPLALRAAKVHELIKTADLSQEGVIESLVAMAEEQAGKDVRVEPAAVWAAGPVAPIDKQGCDQPRILTRKFEASEPLPANMPDPLTPRVLARYRNYAQESYAPDQTN